MEISDFCLNYGNVEISIAYTLETGIDDPEIKVLNVDSICLFHSDYGDITQLYTKDLNNVIYTENLVDELSKIKNFIDCIGAFVRVVKCVKEKGGKLM